MLVLEQKLPREGIRVAVVADESARDKYNLLRYPCEFEDIGKPVDFSRAVAHFPTMRPLAEVLEAYRVA
jgi:hypothetical protein